MATCDICKENASSWSRLGKLTVCQACLESDHPEQRQPKPTEFYDFRRKKHPHIKNRRYKGYHIWYNENTEKWYIVDHHVPPEAWTPYPSLKDAMEIVTIYDEDAKRRMTRG